jgi:hypothetical protein
MQTAGRFGAAFDTHHSRTWWFGIFIMWKQLIVGIILGTVRNPTNNASGILVMQVFEALVVLFLRPFSDRCVWCVCVSVSVWLIFDMVLQCFTHYIKFLFG